MGPGCQRLLIETMVILTRIKAINKMMKTCFLFVLLMLIQNGLAFSSPKQYYIKSDNTCAVVIPDKHGKNNCIKYSVVEEYISRAILSNDLISQFQLESENGKSIERGSKEYLHILGEVLVDTTKSLATKYKLNKKTLNKYLPMIDTMKTTLSKYCPVFLRTWNCDNKRYRSYDGTCTNLKHPLWGMASTTYKRFLPADYDGLIEDPRISVTGSKLDLPSARVLSLIINKDQKRCDQTANTLHMSFGQLLNHDMTLKQPFKSLTCCDSSEEGDKGHSMCIPIEVHPKDRFYFDKNISCLSLTRSQYGVPAFCKLGTMGQLNLQSSAFDGSVVYGFNYELVNSFRTHIDGKRTVDIFDNEKMGVLPGKDGCKTMAPPDNTCIWASGDPRVPEHPGLSVMHLLFCRLHNFIADVLKNQHPTWNDDQLFHEARHIQVAIFQHITYNEYLPLILGLDTVKKFGILPNQGYSKLKHDVNVDPGMTHVVATAALRICHAHVPGFFETRDAYGGLLKRQDLSDVLMKPVNAYVDDVIMGAAYQCSHDRGPSMTSELRGKMFKTAAGIGNDLAAINVQRGRDHGIPSFNKWRKFCGLKPLKNWKDLYQVVEESSSADAMAKLYKTVEDIDVWTGGVAEKLLPGALVGPTTACLLAQGFKDNMVGDRFFYANYGMPSSFTPGQLNQIKKIRFSSLLCTLTDDIQFIQPYAFGLPNKGNERINCEHIPKINLSAWKGMPAPEIPQSLL